MIRVTFSTAVGLYVTFSIFVIFLIWIFFERMDVLKHFAFTQRYFWRCAICTAPYVDSQHEEFSHCPYCHSLNQRGEEK